MAGSAGELVGQASDGHTAHALIADKGDPGNRVTVKCLCESALALDELPARAGFLTPSTGLEDLIQLSRGESYESLANVPSPSQSHASFGAYAPMEKGG